MPSADCYTDHRLVRCKVSFILKPPPKTKGPQSKKLQMLKLRISETKVEFQIKLEEKLSSEADPDTDPEHQWTQLKTVLQETTAEIVGFSTRKHQDWF
ncbi:hypothetical protein ACOMHN_011666 [Nucella lapillus]